MKKLLALILFAVSCVATAEPFRPGAGLLEIRSPFMSIGTFMSLSDREQIMVVAGFAEAKFRRCVPEGVPASYLRDVFIAHITRPGVNAEAVNSMPVSVITLIIAVQYKCEL